MWSITTLVAPVAGPAARRMDHRQHLGPDFHINIPRHRSRRVTWMIYRPRETATIGAPPIDGLGLLVIWAARCR
jgi:hypothetical protein